MSTETRTTAPLRLPPLDLHIGGAWRPAGSGRRFATINPASGKPLCEVAEADAKDVDAAVQAAREALAGKWGRMAASERGKLLWKLGDRILENLEDLAALESADTGKPIAEARLIDVPLTADCFHYYAGLATKIEGATVPVRGPFLCYTLREPVGVMGLITPWNFPMLLAARKLAVALAAGNAILHKPASETPLSALRLAELAQEVGFPPGTWNTIPGRGSVAGAAIVEHPGVSGLAFTGSTEVGQQLMRQAAGTLKKLTLELGGKSPHIVLADADLEQASKFAMLGIFYNAGEVCTAGSRLFVESGIYDAFMEKLVQRSAKLVPGDPADPQTRLGPLASAHHLETVQRYVETGKKEGAALLLGGARSDVPNRDGYYFQPTIFGGVHSEMTIAREEIFGPVLAAQRFDSMDDLVTQANATPYGLAAGVWTRDVKKAHSLARALKAGTIWVNTYNMFDTAAPYGGYKASGFGRESGVAALESYTQLKTVWVDLKE
ncbi:MAG TPA: aldehyde dehydrogenase family protein [Candidatus Krumholzibacteria bacterium]|nr:aldehyde dehydrogenase family protein [Candidatus Krumholzibacteria bacterium]